MQDLVREIGKSITTLTSAPSFRTSVDRLDPGEDDDVLVNNSFVFRQGVDTRKSRYHLVLERENGAIQPLPYVVELPTTFHKDFKLLHHHREPDAKYSLPDAIEHQLERLGRLVFILIGRLDDSVKLSEDIGHSEYSKLVLDPTQDRSAHITDDEDIIISDTYNEELIWAAIEESTADVSDDRMKGLRSEIGTALDKLQSEAFAYLRLPGSDEGAGRPIIREINEVLRNQHEQYEQALTRCDGDPEKDRQAYNELMRIAYNFSSDALTFLRLLVSVCDLKPLVLWGTIGQRYGTVGSFRALPWVRSHRKPSLRNYRNTIGDARNNAFHDLFPFQKALEVSLPSESLRSISLRIFSEHGNKNQNELRYEDKELIEVLTDFTRARRRFVPPEFWRQNAEVMNNTIELFGRTADYLEVLVREVE